MKGNELLSAEKQQLPCLLGRRVYVETAGTFGLIRIPVSPSRVSSNKQVACAVWRSPSSSRRKISRRHRRERGRPYRRQQPAPTCLRNNTEGDWSTGVRLAKVVTLWSNWVANAIRGVGLEVPTGVQIWDIWADLRCELDCAAKGLSLVS